MPHVKAGLSGLSPRESSTGEDQRVAGVTVRERGGVVRADAVNSG